MEFKNKNDYTVIVFFDDGKPPLKSEFVHNCYKMALWLNESRNYSTWKYFNVYARRTQRYIRRFYPNSFIEPKPQ